MELEQGGGRGSVASAFLVWFLSKMEFGKRVLREFGRSGNIPALIPLYPLSPVGSQPGGNPWRRPACILGLHDRPRSQPDGASQAASQGGKERAGEKRQNREEGLRASLPCSPPCREVREQVELSTIEELIEDAIVSTQPAMMVNLRACSAPGGLVSRHSKQIVCVRVVSSVLCWDSCSSFLPPPALRFPVRSHPWAPQAQPSIPRPIRLFLRQLEHHLGGRLEGESQASGGLPKLWLQAFPGPSAQGITFLLLNGLSAWI